MSEISWLRERSAAMRASMDCHDFSDAIDVVLGHLANVETSRADALTRVGALEREATIRTKTVVRLREEAKALVKERADAYVAQETMEAVIEEGQTRATRVTELEKRLSQYECPLHETPEFGECDTCDSLNQEPPEQTGPWS